MHRRMDFRGQIAAQGIQGGHVNAEVSPRIAVILVP